MNSSIQLGPEQIRARIRSAVLEPLGGAFAAVPDDVPLADALGERYDSLAALECITAVEEAFEIEVDLVADDVRHWFATIERMAQFVQDRLEDTAALHRER